MMRTTLLVAAVTVLVAAPAASARPGTRSFDRTYPHASRLCNHVANGHAPKRLASSTVQVTAACTTLKTSFTNAQNSYNTTVAPLKQQATDALKSLKATCQAAHAAGDNKTCKTARFNTRTQVMALRVQWRTAASTYHTSVDGARKTFWAAIRSLKGGSTITPDRATPSPTSPLPSDTTVNNT
jgi:FlaG/FlaF family flagellin (archaellin)